MVLSVRRVLDYKCSRLLSIFPKALFYIMQIVYIKLCKIVFSGRPQVHEVKVVTHFYASIHTLIESSHIFMYLNCSLNYYKIHLQQKCPYCSPINIVKNGITGVY